LSILVGSCGNNQKAQINPNAKHIAVVIKATDSEFWQSLSLGAQKYAAQNSNDVYVTTYGPPSEANVAEQVAILENVVSSQPDGIVIAPANEISTVLAINTAMAANIPVVTADNSVTTKVLAHIATDNIQGGSDAAVAFVKAAKLRNQELVGSVAIISPEVFEVITKREQGFINKMKEIAPNIKILEPRYINNDIAQALSVAQDIILATPDLIGFYGANNHGADGIIRALRETKRYEDLITVAYDSDPEEIQGLADGIIDALIVQDPWALGYKGVEFIMKSLNGEEVVEYLNPGVATITKDNMNDPDMQALLNPKLRENY